MAKAYGYARQSTRPERRWEVREEDVSRNPDILIYEPGYGIVAVMGGGDLETRRKDAALIAAAPELLAACKLGKEYLDRMGLDWVGNGPDPLEAAIAKAEGRGCDAS